MQVCRVAICLIRFFLEFLVWLVASLAWGLGLGSSLLPGGIEYGPMLGVGSLFGLLPDLFTRRCSCCCV